MNCNHDIKIVKSTHDEDIQFVRKGLTDYNLGSVTDLGLEPLNLILRKNDDEIIGGLLGKLYLKCLYVDILWIHEDYRKHGYGKKLLVEAEQMAKERGCHFIHLDTFSFQAPIFYQKNGFEIFGTLDGYPNEIKRYYLKKNI